MAFSSITPISRDFLDLASQDTVKKILLRLCDDGKLQRLSPGIYYFPKKSKLLGDLSPRIDKIAAAIARKNKIRVLVSESLAANLLGLTTQVPSKNVFLTDGKTKKITIGKQAIFFKHTAPKIMRLSKRKGSIVVQALKYFGKDRIDSKIIDILKKSLPSSVKKDLIKCKLFVAEWMRPKLDELTEENS